MKVDDRAREKVAVATTRALEVASEVVARAEVTIVTRT